jgi:23S rRNA G2445 N2-methylase RlmL
MSVYTQQSSLFISCNKRLAPYLKMETEALGFKVDESLASGIWLQGNLQDCIRLNLHLRCASQVWYSLKKFACHSPQNLYDEAIKMAWEDLIPDDGYFSVNSQVFHPSVNTINFANVKLKDAIVDRIRNKTGKRPDTGPNLDQSVVYLFWKDDQAEIFLDTSGETLAKHGYRKIPGKAPMLEALAAATILATKWDRKSPFINPMCGSGTLAIEAAMLATHRKPGLFRSNYAFMHFQGYEHAFYETEKMRLEEEVREVPGLKIIASDISEDAIYVAGVNAGIAGVSDYISFKTCDFAETDVPENEAGVVMFNPEYGERLGQEKDLEEIYGRIGDFLKKKCRGYTGYVFTGNLDLAKKIGLKASRRIEFYTVRIDCRLLEYELYAGSKREAGG